MGRRVAPVARDVQRDVTDEPDSALVRVPLQCEPLALEARLGASLSSPANAIHPRATCPPAHHPRPRRRRRAATRAGASRPTSPANAEPRQYRRTAARREYATGAAAPGLTCRDEPIDGPVRLLVEAPGRQRGDMQQHATRASGAEHGAHRPRPARSRRRARASSGNTRRRATRCSTLRAKCSASSPGRPRRRPRRRRSSVRRRSASPTPGRSPAAARISATTRSASASERPQFVPTGCDAQGDDCRDGVGRAQTHHRPRAHVERERNDERQVSNALDSLDRPHGLFDGEDRLEHQQVDAALGQRARLFGVAQRPRPRGSAARTARSAGRSGRASPPRGALPAPSRASSAARRFTSRASSDEGPSVSRSGVAPNVQVRTMSAPASTKAPMQLDDLLGSLEQPLLGCQPRLHAHRLVVRARCAVGDQRAPAGPAGLRTMSFGGAHLSSSLDIDPGCGTLPGHLSRGQVAEASVGRGPQPLSMRSGVAPRPACTLAGSVGVDADELRGAVVGGADVGHRPSSPSTSIAPDSAPLGGELQV